MSFQRQHFILLLKTLFLIGVTYAVILQPMIETLSSFGQSDIEIVDFEAEEEQGKKEKQEEVKKQLPFFDYSLNEFATFNSSLNSAHLHFPWDFSMEIPIPPPEQV